MVTWHGLAPSPSHPISFWGASAGPRDLSFGPSGLLLCNGELVLSLGPQFAGLCSDHGLHDSYSRRREFLFLLTSGRAPAVSHAGPLPSGVSHLGGETGSAFRGEEEPDGGQLRAL